MTKYIRLCKLLNEISSGHKPEVVMQIINRICTWKASSDRRENFAFRQKQKTMSHIFWQERVVELRLVLYLTTNYQEEFHKHHLIRIYMEFVGLRCNNH